ncbi:hypothetical protein KAR91_72880 [Candidatus Pacearchaeota archaeon]|nr:hypothetical protein [Candidatus Pacearchaeota archaeon]
MADCPDSVSKGNQGVLLIRNAGDTAWLVIGGVTSRSMTVDNPVEPVTSSTTVGDYQEAEYTGFSQMTMNVSGVVDSRTGHTVNVGGVNYTVAPTKTLSIAATTGNRSDKFMLVNPYMTADGCFTITTYEDSGDTPGLLNFSATLQSKTAPTIVTV